MKDKPIAFRLIIRRDEEFGTIYLDKGEFYSDLNGHEVKFNLDHLSKRAENLMYFLEGMRSQDKKILTPTEKEILTDLKKLTPKEQSRYLWDLDMTEGITKINKKIREEYQEMIK